MPEFTVTRIERTVEGVAEIVCRDGTNTPTVVNVRVSESRKV